MKTLRLRFSPPDPLCRLSDKNLKLLMWTTTIALTASVSPLGAQTDAPKTPDIKPIVTGPGPAAIALTNAVLASDRERVESLVAADPASMSIGVNDGMTALHQAVLWRDRDLVRWFLDKGALVDAIDLKGRTPLLLAIESRQEALVDLLLAKGARASGIEPVGGTTSTKAPTIVRPLEKALSVGSSAIVTRLINAGADLSPKRYWNFFNQPQSLGPFSLGQVALIEAADAGDVVLQKLLLDKGVAPAWAHLLKRPLLRGDLMTVRLLVERGADVNGDANFPEQAESENYGSDRPLHWAASRRGNNEAVQLLLSKGARHDLLGNSRLSVLDKAIATGDRDSVLALLDKGVLSVKISERYDQKTPLERVIGSFDRAMLLLLVQKGAKHADALTDAILQGDAAGTKALPLPTTDERPSRDAQRTLLHLASWLGKPDIVSALLERGFDVKTKGPHGETPLHMAVLSGDLATIRLLLDKGAEVNASALGMTPLHFAAMRAGAPVVSLLLKSGAQRDGLPRDPADEIAAKAANRTLRSVLTPLFVAARWGNGAAVAALLDSGADANASGEAGITPLMMAAQNRDALSITALLAKGAKIEARDNIGEAAWHYATRGLKRGWAEPMWGQQAPRPKLTTDAVPAFEALKKAKSTVDSGPAAEGPQIIGTRWELPAGIAAQNNDTKALAWLLDNGTAPGARNSRNDTLLHLAASAGSEDAVTLLLSRKANVNAEDGYGRTALDLAERRGQATQSYVDFPFVGANYSLDSQNTWMDTEDITRPALLRSDLERVALQLRQAGGGVGGGPFLKAVQSGAIALVQDLLVQQPALAKTVMVSAPSTKGGIESLLFPPEFRTYDTPYVITPLNMAFGSTQHSKMTMVRMFRTLIRSGVPLRVEKQTNNLLKGALDTKSIELMQLFLDSGAPLEQRDETGKTVLFHAASSSNLEMTKFLLDKGADVKAVDSEGATALWGLSSSPEGKAVRALLEERGVPKVVSYRTMVQRDDAVALAAALDATPKLVHHRFPGGDTLLHEAVVGARLKTIELLLARGADIQARGEFGRTPLHSALGPNLPLHSSTIAQYPPGAPIPGKPEAIKLLLTMLLEKGANPNFDPDVGQPERWGTVEGKKMRISLARPVLFMAARNGDKEIVELLLQRGAKIDIKDVNGVTPSEWVTQQGNIMMGDFLRARAEKVK